MRGSEPALGLNLAYCKHCRLLALQIFKNTSRSYITELVAKSSMVMSGLEKPSHSTSGASGQEVLEDSLVGSYIICLRVLDLLKTLSHTSCCSCLARHILCMSCKCHVCYISIKRRRNCGIGQRLKRCWVQ